MCLRYPKEAIGHCHNWSMARTIYAPSCIAVMHAPLSMLALSTMLMDTMAAASFAIQSLG